MLAQAAAIRQDSSSMRRLRAELRAVCSASTGLARALDPPAGGALVTTTAADLSG